jgi:2'-5' RNA ligase
VELIRAFFAVNLSVGVLRDIAEVGRVERPHCADSGWKIKWIAPPNLHIVIRCLGEIDSVLPHALRDHITPLAANLPALPLRARGIQALEIPTLSEEPPAAVVVAQIEDESGCLATLRDSLATPLAAAGLPLPANTEPTPWTPHVVVGRVLERGETPLSDVLAEWGHTDFGQSLAREIVLYRSDGARVGQEFTRLWQLPLRGPMPEQPAPAPEPPVESPTTTSDDNAAATAHTPEEEVTTSTPEPVEQAPNEEPQDHDEQDDKTTAPKDNDAN